MTPIVLTSPELANLTELVLPRRGRVHYVLRDDGTIAAFWRRPHASGAISASQFTGDALAFVRWLLEKSQP